MYLIRRASEIWAVATELKYLVRQTDFWDKHEKSSVLSEFKSGKLQVIQAFVSLRHACSDVSSVFIDT